METDARTYREEVADEEWAVMQDASLQFLLDRVQELVDATGADDRDGMADAVGALNDELARMEAAEKRRSRSDDLARTKASVSESPEVAKDTSRRQETRQERSKRRAKTDRSRS